MEQAVGDVADGEPTSDALLAAVEQPLFGIIVELAGPRQPGQRPGIEVIGLRAWRMPV
jgi:hypothetical protein